MPRTRGRSLPLQLQRAGERGGRAQRWRGSREGGGGEARGGRRPTATTRDNSCPAARARGSSANVLRHRTMLLPPERTERRATKLRPVLPGQDRLVLRGIPPGTAAAPALHPTTASRASPEDRPVPGAR